MHLDLYVNSFPDMDQLFCLIPGLLCEIVTVTSLVIRLMVR